MESVKPLQKPCYFLVDILYLILVQMRETLVGVFWDSRRVKSIDRFNQIGILKIVF
jgi:hypothetical protein